MSPTPHEPSAVEIPVRADHFVRNLVIACVGIEVLLVLFDYHVNYGRLTLLGSVRRLANITREDSLASWLGTTQTLLTALTLWLVWAAVRTHSAARWRRVGWLVLAIFFSFMAVDDGAMLHERAGTAFVDLHADDAEGGKASDLGAQALDAFPSYAWQIVVLPPFIALGLFMFVFLWRESASSRARLVLVVAMGCLTVAVGLDFIEGMSRDHPWNLHMRLAQLVDFGDWTEYRFRRDAFETVRHFSKSIEEFLEMFAGTLLWSLFLRRLIEIAPELRIRFR